jgi:hypothetical protein
MEMAEQDGYGQASLQYLRKAIRANRVVFPVPVPIFPCQHRADIQWRLVELYFVHGWSCTHLGQRYKVTDRRIQQLIQRWVARAKALGYLQAIPTEQPEPVRMNSESFAAGALEELAAPPPVAHEEVLAADPVDVWR